MKKILIIMFAFCCMIELSACANLQERENVVVAENYGNYEGIWAVDGKSHEAILSSGGAELICNIENGNEFTGSLFVQQSNTERIATVENITGTIENNELYFEFLDDGWGGLGKLYLQFKDEKIVVEVLDYQPGKDNLVGYGINGRYEMLVVTGEADDIFYSTVSQESYSNEEMLDKFYEQFYQGLTNEEIEERLIERHSYYQSSTYYEVVIEYWENIREVTDTTNRIEPLYFTDMKYYTKEEFLNVPPEIIHLAKNEIYAKHGYIFKDQSLYNYFMGCAWYQPKYNGEEFSDLIFNDYEKHNLRLLLELDE